MTKNRGLILAVALVVSLIMGNLYAFSIFIGPLETSFGWARHETALTFSFIMVFFSLGMITGGNLMARLGPANTAALGGLMAAAGFFVSSMITNLWTLYIAYGAVAGYGLGITNLVPMSILMRWFPDKKGLVSGLLTMFLAFGTFFLGSKLCGHLITVYGWSATFKVMAGFFVLVILGSRFMVFPPEGYQPPNWSPPPGQAALWGYNRLNMLKTGVAWALCLWMFGIQFGGLMVNAHIMPLAEEQNIARAAAANALGTYAIANGVGRLFFGWMVDKAGLKVSMSLDSMFMVAGLLGVLYLFPMMGYPGLLIGVAFIGMGYGGVIPQAALLAALFFGPKFFPKNYGFYTLPGGIVAGFLAPSFAGYVRTQQGTYTLALMVAVALSALTLIVSLTAKPPERRTDDA